MIESGIYRCEPFDLNDQALIEAARLTGQPEHVARAVEAAVTGFRKRITKLFPLPVVNGELAIMVMKPQNFFDDYCQSIVLQEICDSTGFGVMRVMTFPPAGQKQPSSPDVEFD